MKSKQDGRKGKKASVYEDGQDRFSVLAIVCDLYAENRGKAVSKEKIAYRFNAGRSEEAGLVGFIADCLAGRGLLDQTKVLIGGSDGETRCVLYYRPTARGRRVALRVSREMFRASWPNNWREWFRDVKRRIRRVRFVVRRFVWGPGVYAAKP